jgi:hypothetical protein
MWFPHGAHFALYSYVKKENAHYWALQNQKTVNGNPLHQFFYPLSTHGTMNKVLKL